MSVHLQNYVPKFIKRVEDAIKRSRERMMFTTVNKSKAQTKYNITLSTAVALNTMSH